MNNASSAHDLAQIVIRGLARGKAVEIDGLGIFYPDDSSGCRFEPHPPQVFLAYGREDQQSALRLYDGLEAGGFGPWMDVRKLLPGRNWPRAIESAIEGADFFVACFSCRSVNQRGAFQAEIRYALDCARRIPLDDIFVIPVRLDECRVPRSIRRELQYIDLFPDWDRGMRRLLGTLRRSIPSGSLLR